MKSRVLTAIGLIPIVLGAFFCASPWPLVALAIVAGGLCCFELASLLKNPAVYFGVFFVFADFFLNPHYTFQPLSFDLNVLTFFALGLLCTTWCSKRVGKGMLLPAFSSFWFFGPLLCLIALHESHPTSSATWIFKTPVLLAVLPLWGGDTAAIFAGKAFGKHPLAPSISPKKTVEGGIANLLACIAVAVPLGLWLNFPWWVGTLCGLVAGVFGQAGDLFESFLKRQVGVKDSGKLLPGHGGLLDRIDSILFTAPFVSLIVALSHLNQS